MALSPAAPGTRKPATPKLSNTASVTPTHSQVVPQAQIQPYFRCQHQYVCRRLLPAVHGQGQSVAVVMSLSLCLPVPLSASTTVCQHRPTNSSTMCCVDPRNTLSSMVSQPAELAGHSAGQLSLWPPCACCTWVIHSLHVVGRRRTDQYTEYLREGLDGAQWHRGRTQVCFFRMHGMAIEDL